MTPLMIAGAGGFGREVLDIVEAVNAAKPTFAIIHGCEIRNRAMIGAGAVVVCHVAPGVTVAGVPARVL